MTANSSMPALTVRQLVALYGRIAVVHGVSLDVEHGEVNAVLGPNGAGKTSLLEAITGRVGARGEIRLDGERIDGMPTHRRTRRGLGLVPTGRGLFPALTVRDNLELGSKLAVPERRDELTERALGFFPVLEDRFNQAAGQLSGGEQQMLAIAKVLVGDPKVLLLDEPTQGLAPHLVDELGRVIVRMREAGLGVLLAEQNQSFAVRVANRYSVLVQGTVRQEGQADALTDREQLFSAYLGDA